MRWHWLCLAALLSAFSPLAWSANGAAQVIVNQTGSVPVASTATPTPAPTTGGTGVVTPPTVPLAGVHVIDFKFAIITKDLPEQASAVATITSGAVTGFTLQDGGTGYTLPPVVTIAGGGGRGARAAATVTAGSVTALRVITPGVGYTSAPVVTIALPPAAPVVTTLWSNDGTSVAGSQPTSAVSIQVVDRLYSAMLGYTGLPNMAPLPRSVLANMDARVRVWFKNGRRFRQIIPDRPLQTIPYAEEATYAETSGTVVDGAITADKLGLGSITADKFAPGAVNDALPGALLASLSPNDAQLSALGYSKVQTFPGHDWVPSVATSAPSPRQRHTAIWTGTSLIVWGGEVSGLLSNQGGEYAPDPKTWSLLSTSNAPAARGGHTAVWTGANMLVWGGVTDLEPGGTATGGIFNEARQSWRATATTGAPSARTQHTSVWCADRMIVWGGQSPNGVVDDGGSLVPPAVPDLVGTGTWTALPASTVAGIRRSHAAIWSGSKMIIWGGLDAEGVPLNTGAALNPADATWTALPTLNAPSARFGHSTIWTGGKMIVFGGADSETDHSAGHLFNDGAIYDPTTNTWTPLPTQGAPEVRLRHGAVWTGSEMLVFSGEGVGGTQLLTAGAFNPATNTWRALPAAPAGTTRLAGVWSGLNLLAFGLGGLEALDPSPTLYLYGRF